MTADQIIDRLMARRAELGLTQRALADRMGYGNSTLDGWERQYRHPKLQQIIDWAEALGVRIEIRS